MKRLKVFAAPGTAELRRALERGDVEWVTSANEADGVLQPSPSADEASVPGELFPRELTPREREMLEFLADGWANEEIADRLAISTHTVKFHLDGLYRKLGVGRRTEAVREGYKLGLLRL